MSDRRTILVLVVLLVGGTGSNAQPAAVQEPFCEETEQRTETLDARGLAVFYCARAPVLTKPLRVAHASARPVFFGAVPVAWGAAYVREGDNFSDAYRLTLAQGATYGLVVGLKHAVGRPRPYVRRALTSRSGHYGEGKGGKYQSFPSGHAAVSAALVTSWSLSHPKWYVIGPGATWAVAVSLSRLYLGVHYPSDVIAGTLLGVGVATLLHQVRGEITPDRLRGGAQPAASSVVPPVGIRIQF